MKDMVAYNNKFDPFYQPRTFVESIDGKKVLELTEGRSTGVPTIQEKLADNGSPRATFETTNMKCPIKCPIKIRIV